MCFVNAQSETLLAKNDAVLHGAQVYGSAGSVGKPHRLAAMHGVPQGQVTVLLLPSTCCRNFAVAPLIPHVLTGTVPRSVKELRGRGTVRRAEAMSLHNMCRCLAAAHAGAILLACICDSTLRVAGVHVAPSCLTNMY